MADLSCERHYRRRFGCTRSGDAVTKGLEVLPRHLDAYGSGWHQARGKRPLTPRRSKFRSMKRIRT